MKHGIFMIWTT